MAYLFLVRRMRAAAVMIALIAGATAAASETEYAKWSWSRELPKEVATAKPAANRTAQAVDALFGRHTTRVSLDDILSSLGQPDGFSRQALYSKTQGTTQPQTQGGTLRFLLSEGGELLVHTGDFHVIFEAIRYDKKGRGTLLEK
jgi:hypothetical protein